MSFWYKGNMIPTGGGGGSEELYSTEETRIGTWIDGKPIYRKVFKDKLNSESGINKVIDVSDLNVSEVTNIYGIAHISNAHFIPLEHFSSASDHLFVSFESNKIILSPGGQSYRSRTVVVILEYTKTTDEAAVSEGEG